jgi:hypothetical protein
VNSIFTSTFTSKEQQAEGFYEFHSVLFLLR